MVRVAVLLILLHIAYFIGWIMDSIIFHTAWGIVSWSLSIVAGFIVQQRIGTEIKIGLLLRGSNFFMVFLVVATIFIYGAVTSMP
ncbi:hypothetical protein [Pontibacillus salipaludis]|uniref:Uncharacterized protein n=1 Tax=Pontibacillus salipaludis TaxID=1697394 RepID=A0ABQ1Q546_9BACI|nr:hypothetical protein [Pontibacillus salipaludis]GGD11935.1 hypothetical protein GCM10011389_19310 [Pontibacillus salipaludis]